MENEGGYRIVDMAEQNAVKAAKTEVAALEETLIEAGSSGDVTAMIDGAAKLAVARERLVRVLAKANAEANAALEKQLATAIRALVEGCDYETRNGRPIDSIIWYCDRSAADPAKGIEPICRVSINAKAAMWKTADGATVRETRSMRDAMAEILRKESPLHRRELHDRLVEMGVSVGGRDPVNNVGAHLSADDRFRNVGRGMWDLTSPYERAGESEGFGNSDGSDDMNDAPESGHGRDDEDEDEDEDSVAW